MQLVTRRRREEGIALVEMALILPVLVLLTFGVIEYGWMFMRAHQVTSAAREGARAGARALAGNADVAAAVTRVMSDARISGYTYSVSPAADGVETGGRFTVTVSVPYANVDLLGIAILPTPATLRSATSMAKEGP